MGAISGEEPRKMEKMPTPGAREEKILVLVRLRPLNEREITANEVADWECINDTTILYRNTLREGSTFPSAYTFDRVFRGDSATRQVYEDGAKEIALSVVNGINSSIFAYGQTSSGKTYTMTGITEFSVADIFDYIRRHEERAFAVKFSAIEIYNEAIRDLLSSDSTPLRLRDDPEKGTIVEKVTEETLRDWNHLKDLVSTCEAQRRIGETSLNERSSRSHQIIRLTVESSAREFLGKENSTNLVASVNFIDLAGSERASQALSAGTRLKEGCHINRSLLTLGTVIRKLSKGRNGHINFRDSKLTRILQPCLGGNARTAIVCTLSPARSHVEQTRNTLLFACCAKEVTTKAQVNVVMSDKALVKHLQRELARLESELRNPAPATSTCDYPALLRKKDLQIQKMEKEIKELTKQRDLAQSRLEDFLRMVGHDETSKSGTRNSPNHKDYAWEDGSVSEASGVVDPRHMDIDDKNSYLSDSVDNLEEVSPRHSGDSDEYCKEVRCIEMEESIHDNNGQNSDGIVDQGAFTGNMNGNRGEMGRSENGFTYNALEQRIHHMRSTVDSLASPYPYEPVLRAEDMSSSRGFKLTRSRSCSENLVTGLSTPPDVLEKDFPSRAESSRTRFPPLVYGSNSKLRRSDSLSSRGSDSTGAHSVKTPTEEGITSIRSFVAGLKDMAKHHGEEADSENFGKHVKDVGLDAMGEASSGTLASWSNEFENRRQAILELWQTCHVSLVHRTYFFLLFKGDPADSIYIGVELRRLLFLKENFSQGNQAVEGGRTLTLASSLKALHRERRMLSKLIGKRFLEAERERMYQRFGVAGNSKRRRLQLANQLWSNPKDMNHVMESAAIVAKLIRFVEQGKALKEMFGLSFTPPKAARRSFGWRNSLGPLF